MSTSALALLIPRVVMPFVLVVAVVVRISISFIRSHVTVGLLLVSSSRIIVSPGILGRIALVVLVMSVAVAIRRTAVLIVLALLLILVVSIVVISRILL